VDTMAAENSKTEAGFTPIFDGQTLAGWSGMEENGQTVVAATESAFSVQDGVMYCSGQGRDSWIRYNQPLKDCVLRLEYKASPDANSGIFLRAEKDKDPVWTGFEIQILDEPGEDAGKHSSGAIYDIITPMRNMRKPAGQWNSFEITMQGSQCRIVMNGFKIIDVDFADFKEPMGKFPMPYCKLPAEGYFGLQNHGGQISFRNIEVKQLGASK
jgi:hypothetical protein